MGKELLRVSDVSIVFGGLRAVDSVSFSVEEGQIYGIIGPNGAGKTTLMNLISGMYEPTSGKILFDGHEIQGLPPYKISEYGIGRTYQNINLFRRLTVLENVIVGTHVRMKTNLFNAIFNTKSKKAEDQQSIDIAGKWLDYFDLSEKAGYKAVNLPYGEQRKLEIARALASHPKLLLLDEPVAGMNLAEKDAVSETIFNIRDMGYTIIIVEHNMKLIMKVCDKITVLKHGKKIAEGVPAEIQNNPDVIESYLGKSGGVR